MNLDGPGLAVCPKLARVFLIIGTVLGSEVLTSYVSAAETNNSASAVVISVEGSVEILQKSATNWVQAKAGQALETGYQVRTGKNSRAMLRLSNFSVLRVGELMEYEIQPPHTASAK